MKAKFTWRKTAIYHTLIHWSGVLTKAELPYEYVNGDGPSFWYVPPSVIEGTAYPEHVRLGSQLESDELNMLLEGTVLIENQYDLVRTYLNEAGKRLTRIRKMVEDGQEFVMQV